MLIQVPRSGYLVALVCGDCREPARCRRCHGPLRQQHRQTRRSVDGRSAAVDLGCAWCGLLHPDWQCPICESRSLRAPVVGADRTAEELGRAFPNTVIRQSSGSEVLPEVPGTPALVVATPGAEPTADGGYAGAVLLDTDLLLLRARPAVVGGGPAPLAGRGRPGPLGRRRWLGDRRRRQRRPGRAGPGPARSGGFAARELAERAEAHFPPAAKVVTVDGTAAHPDRCASACSDPPSRPRSSDRCPLPGVTLAGTEDAVERLTLRTPLTRRGGAGARRSRTSPRSAAPRRATGPSGSGSIRWSWADPAGDRVSRRFRSARLHSGRCASSSPVPLRSPCPASRPCWPPTTRWWPCSPAPTPPAGAGKKLTPSPVAARAAELGIETLTPARPREPEFLARLAEIAPDCCPVVAYGALLPQNLLDLVPHGFINLHFSLLPAWRGAAPVQHAVLAGDAVTGATTFRIVAALDAGPVFATVTEPIGRDRHLRRPAAPAVDHRRRPAGLDARRHRRRQPHRHRAARRGRHPGAQDQRRRRPPGLEPTGHRARPGGPRLRAGPGCLDHLPRRAAQDRLRDPGARPRRPRRGARR